MNACVYPGSFDPLTVGHMDIIRRAAGLFDTVHVAILHNPEKEGLLAVEEKIALIRLATAQIPQVRIARFHGLLAEYLRRTGLRFVVRGLRSQEDFGYEAQMARLNRQLNPDLDTLFLMAEPRHAHISASSVRQIAAFGGSLSGLVPDSILEPLTALLADKYSQKKPSKL